MKTVILNSISEVKTEKSRTDGKVSRKYYTAYFSDASNPFALKRQRNFFQDHNADGTLATWKSGDPAFVGKYVGKEIPGEFINATVSPYKIGENTVTSYTAVVLSGEKLSNIVKAQGHVLAETAQVAVSASAPAEALN